MACRVRQGPIVRGLAAKIQEVLLSYCIRQASLLSMQSLHSMHQMPAQTAFLCITTLMVALPALRTCCTATHHAQASSGVWKATRKASPCRAIL